MPQIAKWMNFQSGRRGEAEASKRLHRRSKHHPIPLRHFVTLLPPLTGGFFRVVIALCQFSKGATAQATPVKIASTMTIGWDASAVFQLLFCRRSLNACEPVCLGLTGIRISCSVVSTVCGLLSVRSGTMPEIHGHRGIIEGKTAAPEDASALRRFFPTAIELILIRPLSCDQASVVSQINKIESKAKRAIDRENVRTKQDSTPA